MTKRIKFLHYQAAGVSDRLYPLARNVIYFIVLINFLRILSTVSCSACYFYIIVVYLLPLCLNRVINNSVMLLWHSNNIICYVPYSLPLTNVNKKCKFTIRTFLCYLICNQVLGNTLSNTN